MNTKEAIEFKQLIQFCEIELGEHPTKYYDKYFNQIINALQRGKKFEKIHIELVEELEKRQRKIRELEKFKKMWEEFKSENKHIGIHFYDEYYDSVKENMDDLEQKYFPKEKK